METLLSCALISDGMPMIMNNITEALKYIQSIFPKMACILADYGNIGLASIEASIHSRPV